MSVLKRYLPLIANLIAAVVFGFAFMFMKSGMNVVGNDAVKFLAFRFTTGFIVLTLLLATGLLKVNFKGKPVHYLFLIGMLNPLTSQVLETTAVAYAPTSQIAVLFSVNPVIIVLFSILINREKPTKRQAFFMLVIIGGLLMTHLVDGQMEGSTSTGVILTLSAVTVISLYRVLIRRASGTFTAFEMIYISTGMGAVGFTSMTLTTHAVRGQLGSFFDGLWNVDFVASILYMGILSCVVAFLCMAYATANLPITVSTSLTKVASVITILVGIFILNEAFRVIDIVGTTIVLLGVIGMSLSYNVHVSNRYVQYKKDMPVLSSESGDDSTEEEQDI